MQVIVLVGPLEALIMVEGMQAPLLPKHQMDLDNNNHKKNQKAHFQPLKEEVHL